MSTDNALEDVVKVVDNAPGSDKVQVVDGPTNPDSVQVVDNVPDNADTVVNGTDDNTEKVQVVENGNEPSSSDKEKENIDDDDDGAGRAMWGNQIEFLMSCIATSVGLGNVWRFPFVAYENGGGAFLIPYIIVLFIVGKPMYYLECVLGQFSTRNSVKVWALSPAIKGTGYAQALACGYILTYYVSIVALCLFYLAMSFQPTLPWAICLAEWDIYNCVPADQTGVANLPNATSSAELYFVHTVLRQSIDVGIHEGIGAPLWDLTLCLLGSWVIIFLIVAQGVKSSGKASYFLAIFPYIVMIILLIRSVTLEGSETGILFFLTPQWEKLLEVQVWYAAVTQVFFSLSVCSGAIIMFSSYNDFKQNIYRDAMIVTTLDTLTSFISGITIFGILGNLAYELGYDDITQVIGTGGASLAFISYPDAIAKSPFVPQLFSVLFFLMMVVLGIGSSVALLSSINTVVLDSFPKVRTIFISAITCSVGFLIGLVYVTPGGQYVLELVDYYGGTFLVLFTAIVEITIIYWLYGLENFCLDIEYMLGIKTYFYWRLCWGFITPVLMLAVFIYAFMSFEAIVYGDGYVYPTAAYAAGYVVLFAGIVLVPLFIIITLVKNRSGNCGETVKRSFLPKESWGPKRSKLHAEWKEFKAEAKADREKVVKNRNEPSSSDKTKENIDDDDDHGAGRARWGNKIEFLMSCIATSVGLGNIWRFPFVAYENGGGAFLIPYVMVLYIVGKPMYYLECVLGQFSTKNSVEYWALSPALKGTGYAQCLGTSYILSYYVSIVALCLYYLAMSFQPILPWAICFAEWKIYNCVPSNSTGISHLPNATSSAELYFVHTVLRQPINVGIHEGIGAPLWDLTLCLLAAWFVIFLIVAQGVKSSGKASYFLAIFPYVIMIILLIRSVTSNGAVKGIMFFLTPQWSKLLKIQVWYAAVTQVFFSLSVCTGAIVMFSSYNDFKQNVYRDAWIVTSLDTLTSFMSGITIFGILGNLAYELGYDDVTKVIGTGGASLAFISYPDAIAKSPFVPQLFSVLFFLMMVVLGIGSSVSLLSALNTVALDSFPKVRTIFISAITCSVGFLAGLVYVTPGGQYVLELVDYYGGTFLFLFTAIVEITAINWLYGVENFCLDIEYMLERETYLYWRLCWGFITPVLMLAVFIYSLVSIEAVVYGDGYVYPTAAYVAGYVVLFAGIILVPLFIITALVKNKTGNCGETVKRSFSPSESWGPKSSKLHAAWKEFKAKAKADREKVNAGILKHIFYIFTGGYRWKSTLASIRN